MSDAGGLLFARYAYPPNELGYCGPDDAAAMLDPDRPDEIARRARFFDGAWAYLEFLAAAAGIADPLDERVVEAYWVGGALLDAADPAALVAHLTVRFAGQPGGTWREAGARAVAHHSFQVFEVYPWATLLLRTGNPAAVTVLDRCRIRTGTVVSVEGERAVVESAPLVWDGTSLGVGAPVVETVAWNALLAGLSPGDRVTLHWDWVCDVVTADQAAAVEAREAVTRSTAWPAARTI